MSNPLGENVLHPSTTPTLRIGIDKDVVDILSERTGKPFVPSTETTSEALRRNCAGLTPQALEWMLPLNVGQVDEAAVQGLDHEWFCGESYNATLKQALAKVKEEWEKEDDLVTLKPLDKWLFATEDIRCSDIQASLEKVLLKVEEGKEKRDPLITPLIAKIFAFTRTTRLSDIELPSEIKSDLEKIEDSGLRDAFMVAFWKLPPEKANKTLGPKPMATDVLWRAALAAQVIGF